MGIGFVVYVGALLAAPCLFYLINWAQQAAPLHEILDSETTLCTARDVNIFHLPLFENITVVTQLSKENCWIFLSQNPWS